MDGWKSKNKIKEKCVFHTTKCSAHTHAHNAHKPHEKKEWKNNKKDEKKCIFINFVIQFWFPQIGNNEMTSN